MTFSTLIQQPSKHGFEQRLSRYLDGFFSNRAGQITIFWVPVEDPEYRPGSSWLELVGAQITQIKRACRRICTTFDSVESYASASDKFQGKPYCCVEVNEAGKLLYFRNEDALTCTPNLKNQGGAK